MAESQPHTPLEANMRTRKPLLERFEAHVDKTPGCWLWTGGSKTRFGYGTLRIDGKPVASHRLAYELFKGEIPDGMFILHSCDVPECVNPEHLRPGTALDNRRDMDERHRARHAAGTECPHAKFTAEQIRAIRSDPRDHRTLAKVYGVYHTTIKDIVDRRRYRNV